MLHILDICGLTEFRPLFDSSARTARSDCRADFCLLLQCTSTHLWRSLSSRSSPQNVFLKEIHHGKGLRPRLLAHKTRSLISGFGIIPTEVPLSPSSLLSPPRVPSGQLNDALSCPLHPAAWKSGARYVIETWDIRSTHNMPSERHRQRTTITIRQTRWRRC